MPRLITVETGVREVARALQLQPQRLRIDLRHHLQRHRWVADQQARHQRPAELPAAQREGRVEGLGLLAGAGPRLDVDGESIAGLRSAEGVGLIHAHQGRDVKSLVELVAQNPTLRLATRKHVGVALPPGDVLDVGHYRFYPLARPVKAVVEADRVEGVADVAQSGQ
jgi:hypothetical protein